QHVHQEEPARSAIRQIAEEVGVPLRHYSPVAYCGRFYGQQKYGAPNLEAITPAGLISVLETLSTGVTELCCHPGTAADPHDQYGSERPSKRATPGNPQEQT